MKYTLIMPNGRTMQFFLYEMAEVYQSIHGGRIVGRPQLKLVA